jgi:MscS family membrane protein
VEGFILAVASEHYRTATHYLRLDSLLPDARDGEVLAIAMQRLLDQGGNLYPYTFISSEPAGKLDDGLAPNLERVGTANVQGETFELVLERSEDPDGGPIWKFSSQTLQRVPAVAEKETVAPLVNKVTPAVLAEKKWVGVPIGHWLSVLLLAVAAWLVAWIVTRMLLYLVPLLGRKARREPTAGVVKAFALPLRIYLAVSVFVVLSQQAGISILLRQRFAPITLVVAIAAVLLLVWRLIDAVTQFSERRLTYPKNMAGVTAVLFVRRSVKNALMVLGLIILLGSLGFDVSTGIAAMGIGGIALALGAQKTVENFVGSVTLITDQPVRVGDFCKIGAVVGTVEQIGMLSTRIRTLARTIVTVPNRELSSLQIENYSHRDRFWFHPTFGLRFETTPDQLRYLLVELRAVLYAHPKVDPDPARIRFTEISADSLSLEVFAYVHAVDFNQFLEVQEDLYLRMMDVIAASGTGFAFPSQTLYVARDQGLSQDKTAAAEAQVRKWRENEHMPIPNFTAERIRHLRNTIPYPADGTVKP